MLEARCPYLIELKERLDLPAGLRGKANPKSSTGRIDVFTRVITDHSDRFDEIAAGYSGPALPRGGAALVPRPGPRGPDPQPAAALRSGRPWLTDDEVRAAHAEEPILFEDGRAGAGRRARAGSNGLFLGLDLHGDAQRPGRPQRRATARRCSTSPRGERSTRAPSGTRSSARRATASSSRRSASTS